MAVKKTTNNRQEKKSFRISESEWYVMRVIWDNPEEMNANEITEKVMELKNWSPKTVRSFLTRLVKKDVLVAVKRKRHGFECLYYTPQVTSDQMLEGKKISFFERFFEGTFHSMLTTFIESGELSRDDLNDLRSQINKKIAEDKSKPEKTEVKAKTKSAAKAKKSTK